MRILGGVLALLTVVSTTAEAQAVDRPFPFAGTVSKMAPVVPNRGDRDTRVTILPVGTSVVVIGRQGFWYHVRYSTPQGERTGLMEYGDIRIDPDASAAWTATETPRFTTRGFVEARALGFGQEDPRGSTRQASDVIVRQEAFVKPARWLQLAAGLDLRQSSQGELEDAWRLDVDDSSVRRPRAAIRRLSASFSSRHISLDVGKQFLRWGRADLLSPVDRFAPRDFVDVLHSEFLPVTGARVALRAADETLEVIWQPRLTPSRLPLMDQRWAIVPAEAEGLTIADQGVVFPDRALLGARWSHVGRIEVALSVFDGFNHLPDLTAERDPLEGRLTLTRTFPRLRTYGGEVSIPTSVVAIRSEAAYFASPSRTSDEYVLYVVEAERQAGDWLFTGGYTGEVVTMRRGSVGFAAEQGAAKAMIGRAAYTIDPRRSLEIQGAVRQNGGGVYTRGEFSQTFGRHWRLTLAGVGIGGKDDDFLGQYRRNSHVSATVRVSY